MRHDIRLGMLPNPFVFRDGTAVVTEEDWMRRREEILCDTIALEFDGMPPKPDTVRVEHLDDRGRGQTTHYRIHCGTKDHPFSFCITAYIPQRPGRMPVIVTGDAMYTVAWTDDVIAQALKRGYAVVMFARTEMAPDYTDHEWQYGIHAVYPDYRFSTISAWAWGYHRVLDALEQTDFADMRYIAATGHSRGGKTVLLAGATDARIRYVNPNGSGTHGCGAYRFLQREEEGKFDRAQGEPLDFMFKTFPYWMGEGLRDYIGREGELPHDSHFIKALVYPRCLIETNGYGDIWANPRGSYLSNLAAREVWRRYGDVRGCVCHYRMGGHGHRPDDFRVLFDYIDADMAQTALPACFRDAPYDDMEALHDWN
ncbi:MAG: hypothetical protein E7604_05835 [Ruminococcaceae bacterium]|nr:hypothetical protein [Oscillospiraceae bacterium]